MVFKAGYVAKMGPLNKLAKPWLVRNLSDLAVTVISRLYSKETMDPVFSHFTCVEGLHPFEFQKLLPLLSEKYEPSDLSQHCTELKKHRLFMWHFGHPQNTMVHQSRSMSSPCLVVPRSPFTLFWAVCLFEQCMCMILIVPLQHAFKHLVVCVVAKFCKDTLLSPSMLVHFARRCEISQGHIMRCSVLQMGRPCVCRCEISQ